MTALSAGGLAAAVVDVSALTVVFERAAVRAQSDAPFTIHFTNKDDGTPHSIPR